MNTLTRAILFATEAHGDQRSEDGTLYILHPLAVMLAGETDAERIVGVLHDTVEDTAVSTADIYSLFGGEVDVAVEALTRRDDETYEEFIERVRLNPLARKVKVNDIYHNLSRPPVKNAERQNRLTSRYLKALGRLDRYR